MTQAELKRIVEFIFEVGSLRRVKRSHLQNLGKTEDSILDHSFRVAMIGYLLATIEGAEADKVLKMCLFHDLAESRTGDRNWIHKKFVKVNESKATRDQLKNLPIQKPVIKLLNEYRIGKTLEARLAKEADILEQAFQLKEYADQGNKEAERWLPHNMVPLKTKTGKMLARLAIKSDVHDWWWRSW
ncbi:MAG: HD domain-containing protein [Candidatus Kerfeldbacteria bacterium]|nr:HD domain-containing protein [Candidatus Kerfeldbacteria bacterium]